MDMLLNDYSRISSPALTTDDLPSQRLVGSLSTRVGCLLLCSTPPPSLSILSARVIDAADDPADIYMTIVPTTPENNGMGPPRPHLRTFSASGSEGDVELLPKPLPITLRAHDVGILHRPSLPAFTIRGAPGGLQLPLWHEEVEGQPSATPPPLPPALLFSLACSMPNIAGPHHAAPAQRTFRGCTRAVPETKQVPRSYAT